MKALPLLALFCLTSTLSHGEVTAPVTRLTVKEVPLIVHGKEFTVAEIVQDNGTHGYSPIESEGFNVEVVNKLKVPTCIHWHGLVDPNKFDGVPFVTQNPILPGESYKYKFSLKQAGTFWMHSHYGLQEQYLASAPLIIRNKPMAAMQEVVIMLPDFTFTPANEVLKGLIEAPAMSMEPAPPLKLYGQTWDDTRNRLTRKEVDGTVANADVEYDALLANRRTIDDPEIIPVTAGKPVRLRIIAASTATNFYVSVPEELSPRLVAVDGSDIEFVAGDYFQLAVAQRIDVIVRIPDGGGAFPIVAQGEGSLLLAGVTLKTENAGAITLPTQAKLNTVSLDYTQERVLRSAEPLRPRPIDNKLACSLEGTMKGYLWKINGHAYPNHQSLDVKAGQRVTVHFTNPTNMGHPMHLHGHVFQVVGLDGEKVEGATRDTLLIPPNQSGTIVFNADNVGIWAFHCHIIYHMARGMFTVLKYETADTSFWKPEESAREMLTLKPGSTLEATLSTSPTTENK